MVFSVVSSLMATVTPVVVDLVENIKIEFIEVDTLVRDGQQNISPRGYGPEMSEEEYHLSRHLNRQTRRSRMTEERSRRMYMKPSLLEVFRRGVCVFELDQDLL